MACYQGGKQKIGKHIYNKLVEIENIYSPKKQLDYMEPFVGFCGVMKHFHKDSRNCLAYDINKDVIDMWQALQNNWIPSGKCSKEKWIQLKTQEPSPERTLYGFVCSFGGMPFNYYLSNNDYASMGTRSVLKIKEKIMNVEFVTSDYRILQPRNMLIYCDPPYRNNVLNNKYFKFDSDEFWEKMRQWSKHNIVVISEFSAPDDFKEVWSLSRPTLSNKVDGARHTEKLFMYKIDPTIFTEI